MVTRKTGMKNEAVHWIPRDFMNQAANETDLRLQNVQQIRSMAVKYWVFFLVRMYQTSVRYLACIIWSSLTGN